MGVKLGQEDANQRSLTVSSSENCLSISVLLLISSIQSLNLFFLIFDDVFVVSTKQLLTICISVASRDC